MIPDPEAKGRIIHGFANSHIEYSLYKAKIRLPHLTRTERVRYIRGLYQLWSLALLGPEPRQQRIRSLKLKDLMVVRDLALSDGTYIPDSTVLAMEDGEPAAAFEQVFVDVSPHVEQLVGDLYEERMGSWCWPNSEGFVGRITIWDSYYNEFKDMLLENTPGRRCPAPETVWDDTSDEEGTW